MASQGPRSSLCGNPPAAGSAQPSPHRHGGPGSGRTPGGQVNLNGVYCASFEDILIKERGILSTSRLTFFPPLIFHNSPKQRTKKREETARFELAVPGPRLGVSSPGCSPLSLLPSCLALFPSYSFIPPFFLFPFFFLDTNSNFARAEIASIFHWPQERS